MARMPTGILHWPKDLSIKVITLDLAICVQTCTIPIHITCTKSLQIGLHLYSHLSFNITTWCITACPVPIWCWSESNGHISARISMQNARVNYFTKIYEFMSRLVVWFFELLVSMAYWGLGGGKEERPPAPLFFAFHFWKWFKFVLSLPFWTFFWKNQKKGRQFHFLARAPETYGTALLMSRAPFLGNIWKTCVTLIHALFAMKFYLCEHVINKKWWEKVKRSFVLI